MSIKKILTSEEAQQRSESFDLSEKVTYNISMQFKQGGSSTRGKLKVSFGLKTIYENFFIDYDDNNQVLKLIINGTEIIDPIEIKALHRGSHFYLPKNLIKIGNNDLIFYFISKFSHHCMGIYHDTKEKTETYIYTSSEPYFGNMLLPMFDQPDIKAYFKLNILTETSWTAISIGKLTSKSASNPDPAYFQMDAEKDICFSFEESQKISSYLFGFYVGEYQEYIHPEKYGDVEFRFYSKKGLFPYLKEQIDEIYDVTITAMKFFEEFFGYKFAFTKYDQIFCPDYLLIAMENPGAVILDDLFIFVSDPTPEEKTKRAQIIIHELAHHWFGNLVTMKWWNDLWLNEAFAECVTYICMEKLKFKHQYFGNHMMFEEKTLTYPIDDCHNTHPVSCKIADTEQAFLSFDGITYNKGCAALYQACKIWGFEAFSKGLQEYFMKHAWGNTVLDDLLFALKNQIKVEDKAEFYDLELWKEDWLMKSGLTQLSVEWNPKGEDKFVKIKQTSTLQEYQSNKYMKVNVAFFNKDGVAVEIKEVIINKEITKVEFDKTKKPVFVFPNYSDQSYIKVKIDPSSLCCFSTCINKISEDLTRAVIWHSLYIMMQDGEVCSPKFFDYACQGISVEKSSFVLTALLSYIKNTVDLFVPVSLRPLFLFKACSILQRRLVDNNLDSSIKPILISYFIEFAVSQEHIKEILEWTLGENKALAHIELTEDATHNIVKKIVLSHSISFEDKREYLQSFNPEGIEEDFIKVAFANSNEREKIWESFFDSKSNENFMITQIKMKTFNSIENVEANKKYHDQFFEKIFLIFDSDKDPKICKITFDTLFPNNDRLDFYLEQIQKLKSLKPKNEASWKQALIFSEDVLKKRIVNYKLLSKT